MSVRKLSVNQTHDPSRGTFLVHPTPVKDKKIHGQQVYFSAVHFDKRGVATRHPDGYEFVVRY